MKKIVLIGSLIVPLLAFAADVTVKPVTITVPEGFDGPFRQEQEGAVVVGFAKNSGPKSKTLLQITVYDFGAQLKASTASERGTAATKFLLDFIGGVARRRTEFKRSEPTPLNISGLQAAKLQWTGKLQGVETVGIMYSFVVGASVVIFHTQDVGITPTLAMNEAVRSFESARVRDGN
jgi:hypothetical protein